MWSYVRNKENQRWLWHAIDHATGEVLAYVFGGSVLNLDIVSSITEFYESIVIIDVIQSQRIGKKKLWF